VRSSPDDVTGAFHSLSNDVVRAICISGRNRKSGIYNLGTGARRASMRVALTVVTPCAPAQGKSAFAAGAGSD